MADFDFTLSAEPILGGVDHAIGENRIVERSDLALVSVATPLGGDDALKQTLMDGWGLAPPDPTASTNNDDARVVHMTPDQMMLIFPHATADASQVVQTKLNGTGYTTDQTDVWVVLEISGPDTIAALERLCPLDAATMPTGGTGRTVMEHMGAMIIRMETDRFLLLSASSSAGSFLHAVETSFKYVT